MFSLKRWTFPSPPFFIINYDYPIPATVRRSVPASSNLPATYYSLSSIHYPLPVTRYPLPATHYPLPATRYPLRATRYLLQIKYISL
ncbi:MAG: hypothetical protein KA792_07215 [Bacteroidales bacterium]|nr:hypothetical protein [Bacteroidales bacterium]